MFLFNMLHLKLSSNSLVEFFSFSGDQKTVDNLTSMRTFDWPTLKIANIQNKEPATFRPSSKYFIAIF